MGVTKGKRQINFLVDEGVLDRMEAWRQSQQFPPSKTAVHEAALIEFLDKRQGKKKKPAA